MALFDRHVGSGDPATTFYEATLIGTLVMHHFLEVNDFSRARDVARTILSRPDRDDSRDVDISHLYVYEGICDLLLGNVHPACQRLLQPLADSRFKGKVYEHLLRLCLSGALHSLKDQERPPEPCLCELTSALLSRYRGCKRISRKALTASTHAELLDLLDASYKWTSGPIKVPQIE